MKVEEKQGEEKAAKKSKEKEKNGEPTQPMKEYKPKILYPTNLEKDFMNGQFGKFLELFK